MILSGTVLVTAEVVDRQKAGEITMPLATDEGLEVVVGAVFANSEDCGVLKTKGEGIGATGAALVVWGEDTENSGCWRPTVKLPR